MYKNYQLTLLDDSQVSGSSDHVYTPREINLVPTHKLGQKLGIDRSTYVDLRQYQSATYMHIHVPYFVSVKTDIL